MIPPHLIILLDRVEIAGKHARACAKNAVGDPDQDYWLADLIRAADDLQAAVTELKRELQTHTVSKNSTPKGAG